MSLKQFALVFISSGIMVMNCFANPANGNDKSMVMEKNKDIMVKAEAVKNDTEMTAGFRIELINLAIDKKLVLMISNNCVHQLTINILNEERLNISPRQELLPANESSRLKYYIIPPQGSGVWFIPIPNKIRKNLLKDNDDNLQLISAGKYKAQIRASFSYFIIDNEDKDIPQNPNYMFLHLALPDVSIEVDPSICGANIEQIYNNSHLNSKGKVK